METIRDVHSNPRNISITPDGRFAYITTMGTGTVTALNLQSHKIVAQIPVPEMGEGLGISPDSRIIYIASRGGNSVYIIYIPSTNSRTRGTTNRSGSDDLPLFEIPLPVNSMILRTRNFRNSGSVSLSRNLRYSGKQRLDEDRRPA